MLACTHSWLLLYLAGMGTQRSACEMTQLGRNPSWFVFWALAVDTCDHVICSGASAALRVFEDFPMTVQWNKIIQVIFMGNVRCHSRWNNSTSAPELVAIATVKIIFWPVTAGKTQVGVIMAESGLLVNSWNKPGRCGYVGLVEKRWNFWCRSFFFQFFGPLLVWMLLAWFSFPAQDIIVCTYAMLRPCISANPFPQPMLMPALVYTRFPDAQNISVLEFKLIYCVRKYCAWVGQTGNRVNIYSQ